MDASHALPKVAASMLVAEDLPVCTVSFRVHAVLGGQEGLYAVGSILELGPPRILSLKSSLISLGSWVPFRGLSLRKSDGDIYPRILFIAIVCSYLFSLTALRGLAPSKLGFSNSFLSALLLSIASLEPFVDGKPASRVPLYVRSVLRLKIDLRYL